ncbi:hypothetical protein LTR28_003698 [Elasticomyces elasticus]|nr:hypothetical protein LTR28_003698 [Elasticomyces elasticus]
MADFKMNGQAGLHANGDVKSYGDNLTNGLLQKEKAESKSVKSLSKEHDLVLKTFRILIADLCEQFAGGHPGGAMGMAAIGVALWRYAMRYAPHSPDWFNRDRFVLSNGHTCLFQYTFLHLTGFRDMTFEQLKSYHSDRPDALCPGHPEIEHEGIEVTTGPLGQGVANAVGMAMATKNLAATYNKPDFEVVNNHTWCMVGDACLQEGVALEAISLAGHLRLNNLTIIYDNNQVTCDGSVDMTNSEDVNAKMRACGWDVLDIEDGCFDVDGITEALEKARDAADKPTFINCRTIIGVGSAVAGDAVAHGAALEKEDVRNMKKVYGFDPDKSLQKGELLDPFFKDLPERGEKWKREWESLVEKYVQQHPKLGKEFVARMKGELPAEWEDLVPKKFDSKPLATRKASGLVFNPVAQKYNTFMVGTADLSPSVNMIYPGKVSFQNPEVQTTCGINGAYTGRYIHYGVREHAMCAIANGMAAYGPNTIIPITSSFLMFYLYAAPGVRMGALQKLQVIHVATHDSIGAGEDGPTHQPVELAALFRAMPGLLYIRPGDSEEVAGAWKVAIENKQAPSMISTSRHSVPQLAPRTSRQGVARGAYVLEEVDGDADADVTLIGSGAELSFATTVAAALRKAPHNLRVRVVSFPCPRLFERQSLDYRRETLRRHRGVPAVVIEAYMPNGWERYADASICMKGFGHSLPGPAAYEYFGFETGKMVERVVGYLERRKGDVVLEREFVEL